jgi:DNA polymerase (family 10)
MASNGKFLYAQVEADADKLIGLIKDTLPGALVEFGGEYRRKCEIITELVIVIGSRDKDILEDTLLKSGIINNIVADHDHLSGELESGLLVDLVCAAKVDFHKTLFLQTGTDKHVETVLSRITVPVDIPEHEELIYQKAGLQFMLPELREDDRFIELAHQDKLPTLITVYDLKGSLHNHSTWSDGVNTLEEMAIYCRDNMKLEYLGICDHSKSAFYAKGHEY